MYLSFIVTMVRIKLICVVATRVNIEYEDVPENMVAETEDRRRELIGE